MMSDTQKVLALIIVGAFIGLLIFWTIIPPPGNPEQISGMINVLIGILAGASSAVVGFYFGSSTGSKNKDDTISQIATTIASGENGKPPTQPPPIEGQPS